MAAFYGFRRGEVLGLKWDAIDFERGTISVIRTVTTITLDGKQTEIEQQSAKTKSSLRILPLIGSFREYFLQVKEAQELNKQVCGNCYNHEYDGFVFVDELGERMRANYLTSAFPKFLESHGLRRMRFHDLRHTAATNMHQLTGDFYTVGEILGHTLKGIGMSLGISTNLEAVTAQYVNVRLERKRAVLETYHKALHPQKPTPDKGSEPKKAKKKSSEIEL